MLFRSKEVRESPKVVWIPLVVLAIPSAVVGWFLVGPMLFQGYFQDAIVVSHSHDVLGEIGAGYHGAFNFFLHAFSAPPIYIAFAGVITAWLLYIKFTHVPAILAERFSFIYRILVNKYHFDDFNQAVFAGGARGIGKLLWNFGDVHVIDGFFVNGSGIAVRWFSGIIRRVQTGFLYHYAFAMILGLLALLGIFVHRILM